MDIVGGSDSFNEYGTTLNVPGHAPRPKTGIGDERRREIRGAADEDTADLAGPGIPNNLPPEVRPAIARIVAERDHLRGELAKARLRVASLERLAYEDSLTPVANRRAFMRQLTRMIAYTHRYRVPASIVYFDINNLKQINDEYGHPAGDAALRHIAKVLRDNIRSSDVAGRLGGDEFGVILARTDEAQALAKAAALAEAIQSTPLHCGEHAIPVSAAYGVYAFAGTDDPQHAIEAADRAMYQQKRATHDAA
jgi:diguanylate cyclase (GGDEF)-like protein